MTRIVIVGAGAAGLAAAEELRRSRFDGTITLVGEEQYVPYDRPPLSKQALEDSWDNARLRLRADADLAALDADFRPGRRAVAADAAQRTVTVDGGEELSYDGLVIATGVVPVPLPGVDSSTLRGLDDASRLRSRLQPGAHVVIIGAGFLGTELAAAAVKRGCRVTLLDRGGSLLARLGEPVSRHVASLHAAQGVEVRSGVRVTHADASGAALADGTWLPADVVIGCVGSVAATAWLEGSGVPVDNGVLCAADCSAAPGVVAAGDVARWFNPAYGSLMRVEHRTNATQQGAHAARTLLANLDGGHGIAFVSVPYAWSHQFDTRIQIHGLTVQGADTEVVAGAEADGSFILAHRVQDRLVGIIGVNAPMREVRRWQQLVHAEAALAAASGVAPPVSLVR
ncbi:NAD(P)/FAD-dependent oxidoreductase [Arthrobacter sp. 3Tela_A]|uniref:NAD(P)/FAD-dependent oxidoreductase n=1 Tax=Arthrobacter sp. 3Tela_A TaxID=3093743 RepID=UPI003BB7A98A